MAEHDGSINLDVRVRRDDFFKGISEIKSAIKSLQSSIEAIGAKIGSATVSNIKDINKNVNDTAATAEKVSDSVGDTTEKFKESKDEADALKKTLEGINVEQTQANPAAGGSALESPLTESANNIKEEADRFMAAAKDFFSATKGFESTIKSSKREMDASVVGYAEAMKNNAKYTQMFEAELSNLRQKQEELRQQKESMAQNGNTDTDEYRRISESLDKVNAEYQRMEELKNEALKPTYLQDWEKLPTVTGRVAEAFAHVKSNVQMAMYAIQHPLQAINRALFAVTSAAIRFARTSFVNVVNGVKNVASSALRAASSIARMVGNLARMAGTSALSFLKRLAAGAQNAAAQLAKLAGRAIISGIKHIGSLAGKASKSLLGLNKSARGDGFKEGLRFIIRYGFGVRSMFMLVRRLRGAIVEAFQAMAQQVPEVNQTLSALKSSLDLMKYSLATAFQPILTTIQPLLTQFMDAISAALERVGIFFATLTGQGYIYRATSAQSDYARSLSQTASAAKEAKNQLAGFDHLNILSAPGDSGSGASDADSAEATFEKVPIESAISDFAQRIKDAFNAGDFFGIGKVFADKLTEIVNGIDWEGIGAKAAEGINKIVAAINGFFDSFDWVDLGTKLATGLNNLIEGVDWTALGRAITQKAAALIETLYGFVSEFDWAEAGKSLGEMAQGMFDNIPWTTISNLIITGVNGALTAAKNFIITFDWAGAGNTLSGNIQSIFEGIDTDAIGAVLTGALNAILDLVSPTLTNINLWTTVGSDFAEALNGVFEDTWLWIKLKWAIINGFDSAIAAFKTWVTTFEWGEAGNRFHDLILGLKDFFPLSELANALIALLKGVFSALNLVFYDTQLFADLGGKLAGFFNRIFSDKELTEQVGQFANNLLKDALSFASGFIEGFEPDKAAKAIKTSLGEIEWENIASGVWETAKKAFKKAYDFATLLLGGERKYDPTTGMMASFDTDSLGTALGNKIRTALEEIPWASIGQTVLETAKKAFGQMEDFLVSLFGITPSEVSDAGGKIAAVGIRIGSIVGNALSKIPWGEILDTAFVSLKSAIDTLMSSEDGKIIVAIAAGLLALKAGLIPLIVQLVAALGKGLVACTPLLTVALITMFGAVAVEATKKLAEVIAELVHQTELQVEAETNTLESGLTSYETLFKTKGRNIANTWARDVYQIELSNGGLADNMAQLAQKIAEGNKNALSQAQSDAYVIMRAYKKVLDTEGAEAAQSWAETNLHITMSTDDMAANMQSTISYVDALISNGSDDILDDLMDASSVVLMQSDNTTTQVESDVSDAVENVNTTVSEGLDGVATTADTKASDIEDSLTQPYENGSFTIDDAMKAAEDAVNSHITGIEELAAKANIADPIKDEMSETVSGVSTGMGDMKGAVSTGLGDVSSTINNDKDGVQKYDTMFKHAWQLTYNTIKTQLMFIKGTVSTHMDDVNKVMSVGMNTVSHQMSSSLNSIRSQVTSTTNALKSTVTQGYNSINSITSSSWNNMVHTIQRSMSSILQTLQSGFRQMVSVANSVNWDYIGKNIMYGVEQGLYDAYPNVRNALRRILNSLKGEAIIHLKIYSPSHVFRDEIGYMIGAGLAKGIEDSEPEVLGSVSKMATDMVKEMDGTDMTAEIGADGDTMLNGLQSVLTTFSDNVENSFTNLLSRLQSIADNVVFKVPNVAAGNVLPYAVQGTGSATTITDTLDKSNDELISAMIQLVNNQTSAIVDAIRKYGTGTNGGVNNRGLADSIIDEINRRTRAQGYSPIQF